MANFINALDYNFVTNNMASGMANTREFMRMQGDAVAKNLLMKFPAGTFYFADELILANNVDLQGEGNSRTKFVFGASRNGKYSGSLGLLTGLMVYDLPDKHFVNGSGMFDSSVNGASLWGFNLAGDNVISSIWSPLTYGNRDWYGDTSKLTLDFRVNIDPATTRATIFAMQTDLDDLTPFQFIYNFVSGKGQFTFKLQTNDGVLHTFRYPGNPGDNEISICVDTELGSIMFFNNGKLIQPQQIPATFTGAHPGRRCADNKEDNPFIFGSTGVYGNVAYFSESPLFTLWAFKISNSIKYAPGAVTQQRIDNQPLSHFNKYFRSEPDTLAVLPMNRTPADVRSNRIMYVDSGTQNGDWTNRPLSTSAIVVDKRHISGFSCVGNNEITDIAIEGYSDYGCAMTMFKTSNLNTRRCAFGKGSRGVGRYPADCSYSHIFEDVTFYGNNHHCFDFLYMLVHMQNCYGDGGRLTNFRSRDCTLSMAGRTFFTDTGTERSIDGTGAFIANGVFTVDGEDYKKPTKSVVRWGTSKITRRGVFQMQNFGAPATPSGIPFMELNHYAGPTSADMMGTSVEFDYLEVNMNPKKNPNSCIFELNHPTWNNISIKGSNFYNNDFSVPFSMINYPTNHAENAKNANSKTSP